ncbi:taurine dioxygenase [Rhodococcus sp. WS3]|uniref:TauD/TfdA dioxygenase family protein n=1 Tax=Rhodococcus sp. WS3 TaxID=2486271 RepID=UPI001144287C|nr:TauD/TfdA family dioxygenase [Rhodococcus sp. WS3]ROZ49749.1 taurine dioxygenase [Rhodococcus sp. WS3]
MGSSNLAVDSQTPDVHESRRMRITPLSANIGALVEGVSLNALNEDEFDELHQTLLKHHVIFLRDQNLSEADHIGLANRWGTPMANPVAKLHGDETVLHSVENNAKKPPLADGFHTDLTYWPEPPNLAILYALDIPAVGGDTLWASLYAVYDSLSEEMKRVCQDLRALHKPSDHFIQANVAMYGAESEQVIRQNLQGAVLPFVRTHEETGRQALFLSSFIDHLVGMHRPESDALLGYLGNLVNNPNYAVRWRWRAGDVAIWDERCTNHRALSDHYPQYRLMRRCTVEGGRPFYRPDGASDPLFEGTFA